MTSPEQELSRHVWRTRYRDLDASAPEMSLEATWERVARAAASAEHESALWYERFLRVLQDFRFLPGGRILAGAGVTRQVTLANCFVMGPIEDSLTGIFDALMEGALTIQQGGGIGYDFSTLRPRGAEARTTGATASGPVSFMQVWDSMCDSLLSSSVREGAMMASLRCDHPDIEAFVESKRQRGALQHFNLSVQVTDAFMQAATSDTEWPLVFPSESGTVERIWSQGKSVRCKVHRVIRARALWNRICECACQCAEPGVLFIDRINAENNLGWREHLTTTNPCAEAPLPPYGACHLGSLNLAAFILNPFSCSAHLSETALEETVHIAVRFLDNIVGLSRYPLPAQRDSALSTRRIGLGITGLADALAMLGLRYDSDAAREFASRTLHLIRNSAYAASIELAVEHAPFPAFDAEKYCATPFIQRLPHDIRTRIEAHGIRNSHLLAIAPAGAISLLARNVSSGIEPIFGLQTVRRVREPDEHYRTFQVTDFAYALFRERFGSRVATPEYFVDATSVSPRDQLLMQAALTPLVDGSISKTISLPPSIGSSDVREIYETAHLLGLKGCTVFSSGTRVGSVQRVDARETLDAASGYCCTVGRPVDQAID